MATSSISRVIMAQFSCIKTKPVKIALYTPNQIFLSDTCYCIFYDDESKCELEPILRMKNQNLA
jgi:hypothetical protein